MEKEVGVPLPKIWELLHSLYLPLTASLTFVGTLKALRSLA